MKYRIIIISFIFVFFGIFLSTLDVVPPSVEVFENIEVFQNDKLTPKEIIKSLTDDKTTEEELDITFANPLTTSVPGNHTNTLIIKDKNNNITKIEFTYFVIEKDTIPPEIIGAKDMSIKLGTKPNLLEGVYATDDKVKELMLIVDDTKVNLNKVGEYPVIYTVSDGENATTITITLTIFKDAKAPAISGIKDLNLKKGSTYDFNHNITVKDDYDSKPKLNIDTSKLNMNKVGTYEIKYTATDDSGNKTEKTTKVNVVDYATNDSNYNSGKIVYLTFDDGPSKFTADILAILKKHDVKATFFVVGNNPDQYASIVKAGHGFGLHTYAHKYEMYKSEEDFYADQNKLEKMIQKELGYSPKIMRFAGGSSNKVSIKFNKGIMTKLTKSVEAKGYRYYDWNCDIGDGLSGVTVKKEVNNIKFCIEQEHEVLHILAHDTKEATRDSMNTVIPLLLDAGYHFEIIDINVEPWHHNINN